MAEKREKKDAKTDKKEKPFFGSGSYIDAAAKRKKALKEAAGPGYTKRDKKSNGNKS